MDNADYHAHPAISKSHLDLIARSPLHYWARYIDENRVPQEATPAMRLGTALHTHVLELDSWDKDIAVSPFGIDRRTKAGKEMWAAFEADSKGKTLITADDAEQVMAMGRAVHSHPAAAMLLNLPGKAETSHFYSDPVLGLELKCRPDWLTNDGKIVVDLKTTDDASGRGFAKSIFQWRYWVQAGFYVNVLEGATGIRPEQFIFCCVEKKAPYAVSVLAADQEMIEQGWRQALRELDVLATCKKANAWPGYSDQIETVSLPPWMRPKADGSLPAPTEIETY
jgi:hypothetical protein